MMDDERRMWEIGGIEQLPEPILESVRPLLSRFQPLDHREVIHPGRIEPGDYPCPHIRISVEIVGVQQMDPIPSRDPNGLVHSIVDAAVRLATPVCNSPLVLADEVHGPVRGTAV